MPTAPVIAPAVPGAASGKSPVPGSEPVEVPAMPASSPEPGNEIVPSGSSWSSSCPTSKLPSIARAASVPSEISRPGSSMVSLASA